MVIDQVHGLQATGMSLNDRFTILASGPAPPVRARTPRPRPAAGNFANQNSMNRHLIEQIARRLEQQSKRQTIRQRLGGPGGLRRFGSESSLPGLRRSNSFGNLSQRGIKSRVSWRQPNGTLNRSMSFSNLSWGAWRGFRRRGGAAQRRPVRRLRGGMNMRRVNRVGAGGARGRGRGLGARAGGARGTRGAPAARGGARGRGRGGGRGGMTRQPPKPVPTKEELDLQLDQYMAGTRSALDHELDVYMKNAMDEE